MKCLFDMKAIKIIDAPNTKVPLNFEGMMDICQAQFLITNPPTTTPLTHRIQSTSTHASIRAQENISQTTNESSLSTIAKVHVLIPFYW